MQVVIDRPRQPGNVRVHHDDPAAWLKDPHCFIEEQPHVLDVVQDVKKYDVGQCPRGDGQTLGIGHGVQPGHPDHVRADDLWRVLLEIAGAAADLQCRAGPQV